MRHNRVELAVVRGDGQHVAQISHRDPPAKPGVDERLPRKPARRRLRPRARIVRKHHHLMSAKRQAVGKRVRGSLDAAALQPWTGRP